MGIFADWQPRYAEYGIATFPVKGKAPAVRGYAKVGTELSRQMVCKHGGADAFGFCPKKAGITVLDVDTPDETILADALARHGETPFLVRSGRGNFQAWYRRQNEGRRIRPYLPLPIDILGGGFVIAPPSIGERGQYEIVRGSLDDLRDLPPFREPPRAASEATVHEGKRNNELWRMCMRDARHCDDFDALLDVARSKNLSFQPPLSDEEVTKIAASAWSYTERGENWFKSGVVTMRHDEVDHLLHTDPDAFVLLAILRRRHQSRRDFVAANAMADSMPRGGWTRKRLAAARECLILHGLIEIVRPARAKTGAALYCFKGGRF